MSSSNQVRVTLIEETTLGATPVAGNFSIVRFTSEGLSGTPETAESAQIRTDRLSSGQIITGLTVGGDLNFELAKEAAVDNLIESAMLSDFATSSPVNADLSIDATLKTINRAAGSFAAEVNVGDFITLANFTNAANNTTVVVTEKTSGTVIKFVGPDDMVTEVDTGNTFKVADKISIGTTKKSFSMEKAFLDLTTKAINYRGMLVSTMKISAAHGSLITGSFGFSGTDQEVVAAAADFITNGRTINAAATTDTFNGSVDMPFIATSALGTFESSEFCVQALDIDLNNNPTAQKCIGTIAPVDFSMGTAQIGITINAYLGNTSWATLQNKLDQTAFSIAFQLKNADGWYGFYIPAIQVSFPDPSSGGANQDVMINMSGNAKVGANGESALYIYKSS